MMRQQGLDSCNQHKLLLALQARCHATLWQVVHPGLKQQQQQQQQQQKPGVVTLQPQDAGPLLAPAAVMGPPRRLQAALQAGISLGQVSTASCMQVTRPQHLCRVVSGLAVSAGAARQAA